MRIHRIKGWRGYGLSERIQDIAVDGDAVEFGPGDLFLAEPLVLTTSGVTLVSSHGWRRTKILPDFDGEGWDSSENALVRIASTQRDQIASVVTTNYGDVRTIVVDESIPAGTEIRVESDNSVDDIALAGSDVVRREVAIVVACNGSDGEFALTLDRKLRQVHGAGAAVYQIDMVRNVALVGFDLVLEGSTVATGVLVDGADGADIRVAGGGASHAVVKIENGSRRHRVKAYGRGGSNALVFVQSSHEGETATDWDAASTLGRCHAEGVPRGLYTERHRAYHNRMTGRIGGGCTGVSIWGAMLGTYDVLVEDCLLTERIDRDPYLVSHMIGTKGGGAGFELMAVQPNTAATEIPYGNRIRAKCVDCRVPDGNGNQGAFYVEDCRYNHVELFDAVNVGREPTAANEYAVGMVLFDSDSIRFDDVKLKSQHLGISFYGGWNRVHFGRVEWDAAGATGTGTALFVWGMHGNGIQQQPISITIDDLVIAESPSYLAIDKADGAQDPIDWAGRAQLRIGRMTDKSTGRIWQDVRWCLMSTNPTRGDTLEQRPAIDVTLDNTTDVFAATAHELPNGAPGYLRGTDPAGAGYTAGALLYVVQRTADTFKLSLTNGGASVNWSSDGAGLEFQSVVTVLVTPTEEQRETKAHAVNGTGWGAGTSLPVGSGFAAFGDLREARVPAGTAPGDRLIAADSRVLVVDNASTEPLAIADTHRTAATGCAGVRVT